ncbi:Maf family protein [Allohahella marinimesophila]|uniref:7-methyl-GTP pyrophosphatase n=1 Tax=Allohahella marinimesophila TaxID=1054972 RepID=A0ABP7NPR5_9GAMM
MTDAVKVKHKPCPIILASTSTYRAALMRQLNMTFSGTAPMYDEAQDSLREQLKGEPDALACHHAIQKALSLSAANANAVIIGSDQTGSCDGALLNKPGHHSAAFAQLTYCSGKNAVFHTAAAVLVPRDLALTRDACPTSGFEHQSWYSEAEALCRSQHRIVTVLETTTLTFRKLSDEEIDAYLTLDQPFDCAGSFKIESHGIGLFSRYQSNDPSALIGLPLIRLASILRSAGISLFQSA